MSSAAVLVKHGIGEDSNASHAADGPDTRLRFRLKTLGTTSTLIAPTSDVVIGKWSHVVAVYDGATMRLYQDGADVGRIQNASIASDVM